MVHALGMDYPGKPVRVRRRGLQGDMPVGHGRRPARLMARIATDATSRVALARVTLRRSGRSQGGPAGIPFSNER